MTTIQLKTEHLSYRITPDSSTDFEVLHDICLETNVQEIACLLEVSGHCSSALLQIIGGIIPSGKGHILFEGKNIMTAPFQQYNQPIGYFKPALLPESAANQQTWKYLANQCKKPFFRNLFNRPCPPKVIFETLVTFLPEAGHPLKKPVKELSSEEILLLPLEAVLLRKPKLLLADTLTSFFPPAAITFLLSKIQELHHQSGLSVLFSTRSPQQAFHLSDRIFVVHNGNIIKTIENQNKTLKNLINLTFTTEELRNQASPCSTLTDLLEKQYI